MASVLDVRGNVVVVDFGRRGPVMLSKRQLASALGRSVRWIEMRQKEGMPSEMRGNKRMYELGEVTAWVEAFEARKAEGMAASRHEAEASAGAPCDSVGEGGSSDGDDPVPPGGAVKAADLLPAA